jgi:hypothetical protein
VTATPEGIALLAVGSILAAVGIGLTAADFSLATAVAAGGTVVAVVGAAALLAPTVRYRRTFAPLPVGAPILALRDALRSGPLGRQRVIATVVALAPRGGVDGAAGMSPDEERRLLALDANDFRTWLDAQLDRLERET